MIELIVEADAVSIVYNRTRGEESHYHLMIIVHTRPSLLAVAGNASTLVVVEGTPVVEHTAVVACTVAAVVADRPGHVATASMVIARTSSRALVWKVHQRMGG